MLFGVIGCLALLAAGPKYGKRQTQIENRYYAFQVQNGYIDPAETEGFGSGSQEEAKQQQAKRQEVSLDNDGGQNPEHAISLGPLLIASTLLMLLGAGGLVVQRRNGSSTTANDKGVGR